MNGTALEPHPIAARYPILEGAEYDDFKASIRSKGQRVRIVLFEGQILDGRNRYRACLELGIEPQTEVFTGTTEEAAILSDALNLDRRHLTREQKRAVVALKLKENPERSDRDVAAEVKVSPSTVANVRKIAQSSGIQLGHLTGRAAPMPSAPRKVQGKDGKKYTVQEKPPYPAPKIAAPPQPPVPIHRQYVPIEDVTAKVVKREHVEEDLSGPARARRITGLDGFRSVLEMLSSTVDGLRSEKLNPLELSSIFDQVAEALRGAGETFAQLAAMPIEEASITVAQQYQKAITKKLEADTEAGKLTKLGAAANLHMLRLVFKMRKS